MKKGWYTSACNRGVAQSGRVLALGARCRMFESCRPDHKNSQLRRVIVFLAFTIPFLKVQGSQFDFCNSIC